MHLEDKIQGLHFWKNGATIVFLDYVYSTVLLDAQSRNTYLQVVFVCLFICLEEFTYTSLAPYV